MGSGRWGPKPHDLLDGIDLGVVAQLRVVCITDIEDLALEREDAVVVSANHRQTRDSQSLGSINVSITC